MNKTSEEPQVSDEPQPAPTSWIPSVEELGARLALVRWRMRWNTKEAAVICGIPPQSWRQWELGQNKPRDVVDVARKISAATGADFMWLLTGEGDSIVKRALENAEGLRQHYFPPGVTTGRYTRLRSLSLDGTRRQRPVVRCLPVDEITRSMGLPS